MARETRPIAASARADVACLRVRARDPGEAERAAAEAYAGGALGLEERGEREACELLIYAPVSRAAEVRAALVSVCGAAGVGAAVPVPGTDWTEAWKAGLTAIEVSSRLRVRPSFLPGAPDAGVVELVIDPGMAFGTGGHASTLLALEWIDAIADSLPPAARVLDLGTGTGVLALAAVSLADTRAIACDVDPDAVFVARANADANDLAARVDCFVGSIEAVREGGFDLVVANLLRRELLPVAEPVARALRAGGHAVVSGLLTAELAAAEASLAVGGLVRAAPPREARSNGERWSALLLRR